MFFAKHYHLIRGYPTIVGSGVKPGSHTSRRLREVANLVHIHPDGYEKLQTWFTYIQTTTRSCKPGSQTSRRLQEVANLVHIHPDGYKKFQDLAEFKVSLVVALNICILEHYIFALVFKK